MDESTIDREAMGQLRHGLSDRSRHEDSRCERHGAGHQECTHAVSQAKAKRSSGSTRDAQRLVVECRPCLVVSGVATSCV